MKEKLKAFASLGLSALCALSLFGCGGTEEEGEWLKDIYADYFPIGTVVKTGTENLYDDEYSLLSHFNSITAEFEMKWAATQPAEGVFNFGLGDGLVDYAKRNKKAVRGHCLVWYKALPSWVLAEGTTKEQALRRIDEHIYGVLEHYGNAVYCWDVCNEVLTDELTAYNYQSRLASNDIYRTGSAASGTECGDWYALCGNDFVKEAFRAADRARKELGLDVKLFYNDYGLNLPYKREACLQMVRELQAEGIAIDGIGMQAHYCIPRGVGVDNGDFDLAEFEKSIRAYTELGLEVQLTELDISIYPYSNSVPVVYDELPESLERIQGAMFGQILSLCRQYAQPRAEGAGRVTGVTFWGVSDESSNLNKEFNRACYPLLFDEWHEPKLGYYEITDFYKNNIQDTEGKL